MKYNNNLMSFGIFVLIILIFSGAFVAAVGIGIAPNNIKISSAMRGTEYDRPLTIFNTGDSANDYSLRADGEAGGWISFYELQDTGVPINITSIGNKSTRALVVRISVPEDAPSGEYRTTIQAATIPKSNNLDSTVAAALVARTLVEINVTGEQIVEGVVNTVVIEENTESGYPLRIATSFKNTGNVIATPGIEVSILKDNGLISRFMSEGAKIKPSTTETIVSEWNTTSADSVGDYLANVRVMLEDRELASESIPFQILPHGTLTRQGSLVDIAVEDKPVAGAAIKISANFKNTGRIDTLAKFSGEVYRNGMRIDSLLSDELLVEKGKDTPLSTYFKIPSLGSYIVKGRVVYEGKETELKETSFDVTETLPENETTGILSAQAVAKSATGSVLFYVIIGVVVAAFFALVIMLRRR